MRINSLWISKYKNIEDTTFEFNNKLIALLVGVNGLGKSNLLEAIVSIFREIDIASSSKHLSTTPTQYFFDFIVDYTCKNNQVKILAKNEVLKIEVKDLEAGIDFQEISFSKFLAHKTELYFPDFIIGYYSGENKRIRELFELHSRIRVQNLKRSKSSESGSILGKLFFTEQNFGELIFFTLWIFKNTDRYGEKVKRLLQKFINIDFESKVEIDICNPDFYKNFPEQNADVLLSNIQEDIANPFWGIKGDIDKLLKVLYNNNSEYSVPISFRDGDHDPNKDINEFVQFNRLDFDSLVDDLKESFDTPVKLFNVLQAADSIGIIHQIKSTIRKQSYSINHNYKQLSEGEQQLLTTIGLLLIAGEYDTLFIFDEPDTHLNPQWQREYVDLIHKFNLEDYNSQVLVATHSPLIVQAAEKADVFLFKKDKKNRTIVLKDPHRIANWRIDHVMMSEYFEIENTRPPRLDEFMRKREEILSKSKLTSEDKAYLEQAKNEFGVLPSGETLDEIENSLLIQRVAEKLKRYDTDN